MSLAPRFDEFSTCGLVHRAAPIFAQTDDDAIGFYRSLGFVDSPAPRDARWPDRQRYDCVLRSSSVTFSRNSGKETS